jgi:hypothetical protein
VRTRSRTLLVTALFGAPACALIAGIEEPRDRPEAGAGDAIAADVTAADVTATDTSAGDTAPDATRDVAPEAAADAALDATSDVARDVAVDAPPDVVALPDGCVDGGPETCTDGIDNDCNGKTDCQDPACAAQGYACVPTVPGGWALSPLSTTALACPAGTASQSYVSATGAPATCGCSCTVGQPPQCGGATIGLQTGTDSTCGGATQSYSTNGCTTTGGGAPAFVAGGPVSASGGTCSVQSMDSVPTVVVTSWFACPSSGPFGAGCSPAGEVCAWVGAGAKCVTAPGVQGCPAGYATSSHALGSGYNDDRACSPPCGGCASTPTASCADATVTFYSGSSCNGGTVPVTLDGTCTSTVEASLSYRYTASAQSVSCGTPTTQIATGGVTLNGTTTACCAN